MGWEGLPNGYHSGHMIGSRSWLWIITRQWELSLTARSMFWEHAVSVLSAQKFGPICVGVKPHPICHCTCVLHGWQRGSAHLKHFFLFFFTFLNADWFKMPASFFFKSLQLFSANIKSASHSYYGNIELEPNKRRINQNQTIIIPNSDFCFSAQLI